MIIAAKALTGFLILILGRQFYSLFVAGVGFLAALELAPRFFPGQAGWNLILIAGVIAVICSLLTFPLKRVVAWLAGGVAAALLIEILPGILGSSADMVSWPIMLAAGAAGALLVAFWFDALILISTALGAALLAQNVRLAGWEPLLIFIFAVIFGLAVQLILLRYEFSAPD